VPEFDFIHWIKQQIKPDARVQIGIGDDLAALKWDAKDLLLAGVDQVLDGVHFDSQFHTPRDIGRKAMNRNLSDCAAMACLPAAALATVALPHGRDLQYARELFLGMQHAADAFGCTLVGGDTGAWPGKLVMTVTILGRSAGIAPVTRGGAKPGDRIYVTGPLGGSILGRHMTFEPRVQLARTLAGEGRITSMIDLSDGLSRDAAHIGRASGAGILIESDRVPIHEDAQALFQKDRVSPLDHALHDGEDYELLFTSGFDFTPDVAVKIGRIVAESGVWIERDGRREPLEPRGWEHQI